MSVVSVVVVSDSVVVSSVVVSSVVVSSVVVSPVVVPSVVVVSVVGGGRLGCPTGPVGTRAETAGGASVLPDAMYTASPRPAGKPRPTIAAARRASRAMRPR